MAGVFAGAISGFGKFYEASDVRVHPAASGVGR
jgi:hypothetical protein